MYCAFHAPLVRRSSATINSFFSVAESSRAGRDFGLDNSFTRIKLRIKRLAHIGRRSQCVDDRPGER